MLASFGDVFRFFVQGGYFMALLLICSVVAVTVILLRSLALRRHLVIPPELETEIAQFQPANQEAATRLAHMAHGNTATLARITETTLVNLHLPKDENQNVVQTVARHEVVKLESGLHVLEIIIGIAPLLGLLGAVSGLVQVFGAFGENASQQDPHAIAKGISEALSTTVVGIAIAIPSLIAHSLLAKKVETMAADMELIISRLLVKFYQQHPEELHHGIDTEAH